MKRILVTGGCGFVGSTICLNLKKKYPAYEISAFDNLKRRGSELNVPRLKEKEILFVHGDVRKSEDLESIENVSTIIDCSAEPSVLSGIDGNLDYLIQTNFNGTVNCLKLARKTGADFVFLSTSRVYSIDKLEQINYSETKTRFSIDKDQSISGISANGVNELFPTSGYRSLYGSTKLSSELIIQEFNRLFGLRAVINRCGVIAGPYQMGKVDQGVVVLWVARHYWKKKLEYIGFGGTGKQVRDMLHIDDLFELVDFQIHHMDTVNGKTYNAGGGLDISASLLELTDVCERVTGNKLAIHPVPKTRKADIPIYISDNSEITRQLGWKPKKSVEIIIKDIFSWINKNEKELAPILK